MNISLQLYTIREHASRDFADALQRVAAIGYRHVELAGYGNLKSAADVKKACADRSEERRVGKECRL